MNEAPMKKMPTVLVVDDDYDLRESIVDILLEDGFEAISAKDGREAFEALRASGVELIVLDLGMPMMDGQSFRQEQLADPEFASIPVVVMSANEDCRETARALGAAASVKKPFVPLTLLSAVEAAAKKPPLPSPSA